MKRSFYALFMLLAAISGPLVVAPKAISRQDAVLSPTEDLIEDKQQSQDDSMVPRSQLEPNQPQCTFSFDFGEAPEDLIVLPEDYDYEIYSSNDYCEIEQFAAKPVTQNETTGEVKPLDFGLWQGCIPGTGDSLCLPFAEFEANSEPWDGPAVAGVEVAKSAEELECEMAEARFREEQLALEEIGNREAASWVVTLFAKAIYGLSSTLSNATVFGADHAVSGIQRINTIEEEKAKELFGNLNHSATLLYEGFASKALDIPKVFENKEVTSILSNYPIPPYCECWANPGQSVDATIQLPSTEVVSDLVADPAFSATLENSLEFEALPTETLPESSENMQHDAPATAQPDNTEESSEFDLQLLQVTVEQAWKFLEEKAETLVRWSKDYDFEPLSQSQVEEINVSP